MPLLLQARSADRACSAKFYGLRRFRITSCERRCLHWIPKSHCRSSSAGIGTPRRQARMRKQRITGRRPPMRNLIFVGTAVTRPEAVGSLYRLQAGGDWQLADGIPRDASVQAITPHPSRDGRVFLATRKGLFRSEDAGQSWTRLNVGDESPPFWSIVVSPHDPDVLIAGTAPVGFYRSEDGGDTWRKCKGEFPERFKISFGGSRAMRVAFHPSNPQRLYAVAEINGLYLSDDGGDSWRSETQGISALAAQPHLKNTELTD